VQIGAIVASSRPLDPLGSASYGALRMKLVGSIEHFMALPLRSPHSFRLTTRKLFRKKSFRSISAFKLFAAIAKGRGLETPSDCR
jgi:hypothetical protein